MAKKKADQVALVIREFRNCIRGFQRKNGYDIYEYNQDNLAVLKKTGKGNCLALSKLFNSICRKKKVKFFCIILKNFAKEKDDMHQVSFICDVKKKSFWLQSNHTITKLKNYNEIVMHSSSNVGWAPDFVVPMRVAEG